MEVDEEPAQVPSAPARVPSAMEHEREHSHSRSPRSERVRIHLRQALAGLESLIEKLAGLEGPITSGNDVPFIDYHLHSALKLVEQPMGTPFGAAPPKAPVAPPVGKLLLTPKWGLAPGPQRG